MVTHRSPKGCEDIPTPNYWPSSPHCAMPNTEVQHEGKGWERLYPRGAVGCGHSKEACSYHWHFCGSPQEQIT
ncbi:unnamed protein product [Urochloa humidicola]